MKKNLNIEAVKILSCFAVVGIHTFWYPDSRFNMLSYYLMSFAVPVFFMVNGYLILNKENMSWKYILHKELSYVRIIVGWNLGWFCLTSLRYRTFENPFKWIADSFIQLGRFWHFWFFAAIMIIYLMVPFVYKLIRMNKWILPALIALLLIVCSVVDVISIIQEKPVQQNVIQTFRLWTWWLYFLLGAYIRRIVERIRQIETKKLMITRYIISVVIILLSCMYQYYSSRYFIHAVYCEYHYDNLLVICSNVLLFTLLLLIPGKPGWSNMIDKVGKMTMGIYIIHPIVYRFVEKCVVVVDPAGSFMFGFLIFSFSLIITAIMLRCPYIRKLVSL